jgi:hypothetical protein
MFVRYINDPTKLLTGDELDRLYRDEAEYPEI